MTTASLTHNAFPTPIRARVALAAALCAIAALTALALGFAANLISWDLLLFLLASTTFVGALGFARPWSRAVAAGENKAFLAAALVIWIFLMASEGIFVHLVTTSGAAGGQFGTTAYFEALSWGLSFAALIFVGSFRPDYLRNVFSGPLKWASIFCTVAVLSCPLSPNFLYSVSLAFKLGIVVLTLFAVQQCIQGEAGIGRLFSALFIGTLILCFAGFAIPFVGPGPVFEGTRFGMMIGLSGTAGMLLLLSVLFWVLKKNPWFLLAAALSVVLMILVGGKGGIAASFLSFLMFFVLLKRASQAVAACLVFTLIFILVVALTPAGAALESYSSENAGTLTGRTTLWAAVWPEIKQKPIFGHGYRASRFVSSEVEGAFAEAGHIHNAFLEILYNNGVAGLLPILAMNVIIIANLGHALKRPSTISARYYAAGALALYIHLLLWGVTAPTFGSTADSRFMTFFAVLLISVHLKSQSTAKPRLAL